MKPGQVAVDKTVRRQNHEFLDRIMENCYVDVVSGKFHCKRCHNVVHIDWSRNIACCSIHGMLI